jgi:hypothetical protein
MRRIARRKQRPNASPIPSGWVRRDVMTSHPLSWWRGLSQTLYRESNRSASALCITIADPVACRRRDLLRGVASASPIWRCEVDGNGRNLASIGSGPVAGQFGIGWVFLKTTLLLAASPQWVWFRMLNSIRKQRT